MILERSPIYHVEQARTPLLILHGKVDPRVHPTQSLELHRYPEDPAARRRCGWCSIPAKGTATARAASRLDYNLRMMQWFEHYLQGPGGEKPPAEIDPREPGKAAGEEAEGGTEAEPPAEPDAAPDAAPDLEPEIEEEVIEEIEQGTPVEPGAASG